MAYSAIEESQRREVVERCYWPLLNLAEELNLPFGIEVSGYTLDEIFRIDRSCGEKIIELINGSCELIGCGYAQLIGPLVPAEVNAANLRLGMESYERLLGRRPKLALINEQAYSSGLVPLYRDAGFSALLMEWNNPARAHPEWDPEWQYLPHYASACVGESLPLIWNHSIAFQKFQRYVHGEQELEEYLSYIHNHKAESVRAFPVYGNDVEVFDFRPGRYMTEAPLQSEGEWKRIKKLYQALKSDSQIDLIPVSQVLRLLNEPGAAQQLVLGSPAQPTPVKKQDKYNLLRWAVTGRNDLSINTKCWELYATLRESPIASDSDWRELCYLWSSDFRTHITQRRWDAYLKRLQSFATKWSAFGIPLDDVSSSEFKHTVSARPSSSLQYALEGRFLHVKGKRLQVRLNCYRGLALDAMADAEIGIEPFIGTLHHGYFDDIQWGADFYTGHLVFQSPGRAKVTDLSPVDPRVFECPTGLVVSASIDTSMGTIRKEWVIDDENGCVYLRYCLDWPSPTIGSLRFGNVTLIPEAFDANSLKYRTHNGGTKGEIFPLAQADFDHGRGVSFLISANQAVGMTEGIFEFSDDKLQVRIETTQKQAAVVGLVTHARAGGKHFTRLALSAREVDDTSKESPVGELVVEMKISASLTTAS